MAEKKTTEARKKNETLIDAMKDLTGFEFTDIECEIIRYAIFVDDHLNAAENHKEYSEASEIALIQKIKEYRKVKQR